MSTLRDYGPTYITADRKISPGGNTPRGGWIAMFCDRVFADRTNPQHNIEVTLNRAVSQRALEEFLVESLHDPTPWVYDAEPRECARRFLVYLAIRDMTRDGESKRTIHYRRSGSEDTPWEKRHR